MDPKSERDRVSEKRAETGIVESLSSSPMYRQRSNTAFDPITFLDAEDLATFVRTTQPKEWTKLSKQFPGDEAETLAAQVSSLVKKRGTLEVLRMVFLSTVSIHSLPSSNPLPAAIRNIRLVTKQTALPLCGKYTSRPNPPTNRRTW